jgi:DNA-binding FadR family transcriptional regulator
VDHIVHELRNRALEAEPGSCLGTEMSLGQTFNVTAPTLRQAARQLEHEGVMHVRRGVRGGYFAARPDVETVAQIATTYLRSRIHSLDEVWELMQTIIPLQVDLVLRSDRIDEVAPWCAVPDGPRSFEEFVREEGDFVSLLNDMCGNVPLLLVLSIFLEMGETTSFVARNVDAQMQDLVRAERVALAAALMHGDRDAAVRHALEHRRIIHRGIAAHLLISGSQKR